MIFAQCESSDYFHSRYLSCTAYTSDILTVSRCPLESQSALFPPISAVDYDRRERKGPDGALTWSHLLLNTFDDQLVVLFFILRVRRKT